MAPHPHPPMAFASEDGRAFFANVPEIAWHPLTPERGSENPYLDSPFDDIVRAAAGNAFIAAAGAAIEAASSTASPKPSPIRSNYNFSGAYEEFFLLYPIVANIAMRRVQRRGQDFNRVFDRQHEAYGALLDAKERLDKAGYVPLSPHTIANLYQSAFHQSREARLTFQTNMQRKPNDPPLLSNGTPYLFALEFPIASKLARRRFDARGEDWRDVWNMQAHQFRIEDCQKYGPLADIDISFMETNWEAGRSRRVSEGMSPRTVPDVKARELAPPPLPPRPVNRKKGGRFVSLADVVAIAEKRKAGEMGNGGPEFKTVARWEGSQDNKRRADQEEVSPRTVSSPRGQVVSDHEVEPDDQMAVEHGDVPLAAPFDDHRSGWIERVVGLLQHDFSA